MPKLLTLGDDPHAWARTVVHECRRCGASFVLEPKDKFSIEVFQREGDFAVVPCPNCGRDIWTARGNAMPIRDDVIG